MITDPGDGPADDSEDRGERTERALTPAAQRALAEAADRRARLERERREAPREVGGRDGPDPVRYGDWENKGIVADF